MKRKKLGMLLNMELEKVGKEGLVPSKALERYKPDWTQVRQTLSEWTDRGKIACIEERIPTNNGRYALTKYVEGTS